MLPLHRLVLDFAKLLSDFLFTSPFIGLSSPKTLLDDLSGLLFSQQTHGISNEKLQNSLELDTTSSPPSDFFCILELLWCLCRKDPLITFYWPVKLWPPIRVSSRPSQGLRGTLPALCWVIGNGLVGSTSFGSLCPIRSPLTPVPTSAALRLYLAVLKVKTQLETCTFYSFIMTYIYTIVLLVPW